MKIKKVWKADHLKWMDKKFDFSNKKIIDFGSYFNSWVYQKAKRENSEYCGFDISEKAVNWLKNNNFFLDFWSTEEKFDIIVASEVYEHLTFDERNKFIKRSYQILKQNGSLILLYPSFANLEGLKFFSDRTHKLPVAIDEEIEYIENCNFETENYFVGLPRFNFIKTFFNIILGFTPFLKVVVKATKRGVD